MELTETLSVLALVAGFSWSSGLNLYATTCALGLAGATGTVDLPGELYYVESPWVIGAAGVMYCIEFFADKIPWLDSAWGTLHTFIRPPAAAVMGYAATGDVTGVLVGGGVATSSHLSKEGLRAAINMSPEPFTNWAASIGEDVSALGGLWLAFASPWIFVGFLLVFLVVFLILFRKIWSFLKRRRERKRERQEQRRR